MTTATTNPNGYSAAALYRDVDSVKKFVQSNARYKSSHYETVKWGAYDASHRILRNTKVGEKMLADVLGIEGGGAHSLVDLAKILDYFGVRYRPSRVATYVLAQARS